MPYIVCMYCYYLAMDMHCSLKRTEHRTDRYSKRRTFQDLTQEHKRGKQMGLTSIGLHQTLSHRVCRLSSYEWSYPHPINHEAGVPRDEAASGHHHTQDGLLENMRTMIAPAALDIHIDKVAGVISAARQNILTSCA